MRIDPLDAKILRLLREDARLSFREIAERTGSTQPTVGARIKALEDVGLIRGYRVDLDLALTGGPLVQLRIQTKPSTAKAAAEALARAPGAEEVVLLTAGYIHARYRIRPPQVTVPLLHELVADLDGVLTYDLQEVLAAPRPKGLSDLPEHVDVPCHQCGGPIHGAPIRKAFGERTNVFCCRGCLTTFTERYEKRVAAAKPAPRKGHHHH